MTGHTGVAYPEVVEMTEEWKKCKTSHYTSDTTLHRINATVMSTLIFWL